MNYVDGEFAQNPPVRLQREGPARRAMRGVKQLVAAIIRGPRAMCPMCYDDMLVIQDHVVYWDEGLIITSRLWECCSCGQAPGKLQRSYTGSDLPYC